MAKMKILLGTSTFAELDRSPMERLLDSGCEVIPNPFRRKLTRSELLDLLQPDVVGLVAGLELLERRVLEKSHLKVISRCGSGMSNVDLRAARELGIQVYSTPDGPTQAVAELALAAMLSLLRHLPQMNQSAHGALWEKKIGVQLSGKTVVIIGFGRIGRRVGEFVRAFGAIPIAVDPAIPDVPPGVERLQLSEALKRADVITLHSSGDTPIIGEVEFSWMKDGVYLLNAARGGLVNEEALTRALDTGRVAGAWIDTFSQEPYEGPLCRYPQVILTPHVGSYTRECRQAMEMEAVENLLSGLRQAGIGIEVTGARLA